MRRLDVQSNRLTVVENLEGQKDSLEELYLSHNNIGNRGASQPTGIALNFTKLTTLDLSRNRISNAAHFKHLTSLEDLWLSSNKFSSYEDIEPISILGTREGACLEAVYFEYNPIADEYDYRIRLASIIPSLRQIDATMIGAVSTPFYQGSPCAVPSVLKDPSVGEFSNLEEQMKKNQSLAIERAKEQMLEKES